MKLSRSGGLYVRLGRGWSVFVVDAARTAARIRRSRSVIERRGSLRGKAIGGQARVTPASGLACEGCARVMA